MAESLFKSLGDNDEYTRRVRTASAKMYEQMVKARHLIYQSRELIAEIDKILVGPNGYGDAEIKRECHQASQERHHSGNV